MALARNYITPEEYLRLEEHSGEKHEYFLGEIYEMAGGSDVHSLIAMNVGFAVRQQTRGKGCRVYNSDLRVYAEQTGLYTYPDLSVVCGETEYAYGRRDTITNPILLVEVLSPFTEKYDRSQKFELYRALASLQGYLLVDQSRVYVEYHQRTPDDKWVMETLTDLNATLLLPPLAIEITVASLYEDVTFNA